MLKVREEFIALYREEKKEKELFDEWIVRTGRLAEYQAFLASQPREVCEDPHEFFRNDIKDKIIEDYGPAVDWHPNNIKPN